MALIGRPATSKEIAVAMKEAPSKVNYHLKVLEEYKFVEIDHTKTINGIIAKYYKITETRYDWDKSEERSEDNDVAFIQMLESVFNNAKGNYLRIMKNAMSHNETEKTKGMVSSVKYYLNKDEVREVTELFNRLEKNSKEGRELYSFFISMIKEDEQ